MGGFVDEKLDRELLASAARTANSSAEFTVPLQSGAMFYLSVTANPGGAETLTLSIQAKDSVTSKYHTITAFGATTAASNADYLYIVSSAAVLTTAVARTSVQGIPLPRNCRAVVTHSAGGSWTYSLTLLQCA